VKFYFPLKPAFKIRTALNDSSDIGSNESENLEEYNHLKNVANPIKLKETDEVSQLSSINNSYNTKQDIINILGSIVNTNNKIASINNKITDMISSLLVE
jgi:2C-methyl-D-erythritol 2,4-cyclodiphosphate synthase